MVRIIIINGPNLNLLGRRQPDIYGSDTISDLNRICQDAAKGLGIQIRFEQSNHEGDIIALIHEACQNVDAIVINPAAYSHTSVAILDALNAFDGPVVEVHISNIHRREEFRRHSYVSQRADGVISGCGFDGYVMALGHLATLLKK